MLSYVLFACAGALIYCLFANGWDSTMLQLVSQICQCQSICTDSAVLEVNVGLDRKLSLLLGGVIQVMFVIGDSCLGTVSGMDIDKYRFNISDFLL